MPDPLLFKPGTLWEAILERSRTALEHRALQPIATDTRTIPDSGVAFQVRVVSSLARKMREGAAYWREATRDDKPRNPFLPYEEALFVADITRSHICLLNKYNVIDHHILIVTRAFEAQESPLTLRDFEALWGCMAEFDALGFYNAGAEAGASQPHKHLQLVPLPLADDAPLPISALFTPADYAAGLTRLQRLPFLHAFAGLGQLGFGSPTETARSTLELYRHMLQFTHLLGKDDPWPAALRPYNLLVTRRFMLLVPRSQAAFRSVPISALGFAGSFFIPDEETLAAIASVGPMTLLRHIAVEPAAARSP